MLGLAFAMAGNPQQGAGNPLIGFIPLILIFVIFYFLLIRPQQKRAKEHQKFLENLKRGDQVFTSGGLVGRVEKVDHDLVHLEIAPNVKVKVVKAYIAGPLNPPEPK
ncbi:preprotein translocase, YajC subunit [Thermodesulfatator indicus DSM 15286]|uniref:Sec translocon accessory complex subunit YajC n=2 Tax=Thermodesulfatator TaxID=241192 RepID=F8ACJ6_THEID|nr:MULTISPECIES: preprotein translocase subunit YajC [Thermodesulfatator]AEH44700.1 preprotein translocase, YajC subunit [Thermodesulfatator indicus DSM 15286]OAG28099.1 preprotein translocase [Thermodesulfatator autotrophicus]